MRQRGLIFNRGNNKAFLTYNNQNTTNINIIQEAVVFGSGVEHGPLNDANHHIRNNKEWIFLYSHTPA